MKLVKDVIIPSICLPLLWLAALVFDIVSFQNGRPQPIFLRIFEDLVFASSFLFYGKSADPLARGFGSMLGPLTLQFLFWWLIGAILLQGFRYSKNRRSKLKNQKS